MIRTICRPPVGILVPSLMVLSGCGLQTGFLFPAGSVAEVQRLHFWIVFALMLLVVVPIFVTIPNRQRRLVAGLLILKHMHKHSDEALWKRWVENPYFQYFCGGDGFSGTPPTILQ